MINGKASHGKSCKNKTYGMCNIVSLHIDLTSSPIPSRMSASNFRGIWRKCLKIDTGKTFIQLRQLNIYMDIHAIQHKEGRTEQVDKPSLDRWCFSVVFTFVGHLRYL